MRMNALKFAITTLCVALFSVTNSFACECGAPGPACAYISSAPVVFLGTPVYSNDDGSGTFVQQTLYKFKVDEIFKGLPEGTKEAWVDPGSYTSCYAEYKLGIKLLVFASYGSFLPVDTAAMTLGKPTGRQKPLPTGFDPKMPVYDVPECTGTREADSSADDIAWLRTWKKGDSRARIQGFVLDGFNRPLRGVQVIAKADVESLTTTTDAVGAFSFDPVEPGRYDLSASLARYRLRWKPQIEVQEHACGYAALSMDTTGVLSGTVVDKSGRPVPGLELEIAQMRGTEETFPSIDHETTRANGSFRYQGFPAGDYLIGVNLESQPNADTPYARTYAPGVSDRAQAQLIHLAPGQKFSGIRIQLPPRLRLRAVHVRVQWPDGRSVGQGVSVVTDETENGVTDIEETKKDGSASAQCFAAKNCRIEAKMWLTKPGDSATPQLAASLVRQIEAGDEPVSITLVLSERRALW
ncbi:MAG: carboxypeptidase-like regulatory domain-containing protein, partial [Terracidiphilus sp.]